MNGSTRNKNIKDDDIAGQEWFLTRKIFCGIFAGLVFCLAITTFRFKKEYEILGCISFTGLWNV